MGHVGILNSEGGKIMGNGNPFLTKRGFSLFVVFGITFFAFSFVTNALGIYAPGYDEYGGKINAFDLINLVPSIVICYLLEGIIAVALKEEPLYYRHRRYKKEAFIFIGLYFISVIIYMLMHFLDFSAKLSMTIATIPLWGYGLYILYSSFIILPTNEIQASNEVPFITELCSDLEKIGLEGDEAVSLLKKAKHIDNKKIRTPEETSFWFLMNYIVPELIYGHNHIYRGVLSMRGQQLYSCFLRLVSIGSEKKIISQEEAETLRTNIRKDIAEVG